MYRSSNFAGELKQARHYGAAHRGRREGATRGAREIIRVSDFEVRAQIKSEKEYLGPLQINSPIFTSRKRKRVVRRECSAGMLFVSATARRAHVHPRLRRSCAAYPTSPRPSGYEASKRRGRRIRCDDCGLPVISLASASRSIFASLTHY